jgi:hypothetical protein
VSLYIFFKFLLHECLQIYSTTMTISPYSLSRWRIASKSQGNEYFDFSFHSNSYREHQELLTLGFTVISRSSWYSRRFSAKVIHCRRSSDTLMHLSSSQSVYLMLSWHLLLCVMSDPSPRGLPFKTMQTFSSSYLSCMSSPSKSR